MPTSKANKDKASADLSTFTTSSELSLSYIKWLANDPLHSCEQWKKRQQSNVTAVVDPKPITATTFSTVLDEKRRVSRDAFLTEKYGKRWRQKVLHKHVKNVALDLHPAWLQTTIFNTNSRLGRQIACASVSSLSCTHERKLHMLNLLTSFLKNIGEAGEASAEFITLYRSLAYETPYRQYLALKGVLTQITDLLTIEIDKIYRLEETTLSSDLSQGFALKQFVDLIAMFMENAQIRQQYKGALLQPIIQGYLNLRKLVVQRTRLIDDAQEKLLEMLEELTSEFLIFFLI